MDDIREDCARMSYYGIVEFKRKIANGTNEDGRPQADEFVTIYIAPQT
jgi:hypothetical protein